MKSKIPNKLIFKQLKLKRQIKRAEQGYIYSTELADKIRFKDRLKELESALLRINQEILMAKLVAESRQ